MFIIYALVISKLEFVLWIQLDSSCPRSYRFFNL